MKVDLEQLRELIRLLDESNLTEIEVEQDDDRIRVRRDPAVAVGAAQQSVAPGATVSAAPASEPAPADENGSYVTSPFVGTFYRSPSPESDPFVEIGDEIVAGQVLCIVEAMKLMNEIESDVDGVVVEILGRNAQPVEFGEPLFTIRPS